VGFSIENIVLDLTGGTFSLLQEIIDSVANHKSFFGGDDFNVVKFMLSIMSIFFDIIFLIQHYILYPEKKHKEQPVWKNDEEIDNKQKMLSSNEDDEDSSIERINKSQTPQSPKWDLR